MLITWAIKASTMPPVRAVSITVTVIVTVTVTIAVAMAIAIFRRHDNEPVKQVVPPQFAQRHIRSQ